MRANPAWSASVEDPAGDADDGLSAVGIGGGSACGLFCSGGGLKNEANRVLP